MNVALVLTQAVWLTGCWANDGPTLSMAGPATATPLSSQISTVMTEPSSAAVTPLSVTLLEVAPPMSVPFLRH